MTSIEQLFTRLFSLLGKAITKAQPSIDSRLDELDKWLDSKSKP